MILGASNSKQPATWWPFFLSNSIYPEMSFHQTKNQPRSFFVFHLRHLRRKRLSGKIATLQDGEEQQTSKTFFSGFLQGPTKYLVLVPPSHVSFTYHSHTSRNSAIGILMGAKKMGGYRGPWIFAWFKSEFRPKLKSLTFPVSNVGCSKASLLRWKLFWWTWKCQNKIPVYRDLSYHFFHSILCWSQRAVVQKNSQPTPGKHKAWWNQTCKLSPSWDQKKTYPTVLVTSSNFWSTPHPGCQSQMKV